jgi:soluble lytic murein transglycosylase
MPNILKYLSITILLAAPLPASANQVLYEQWKALRDPGAGYVSFEETYRWLTNRPGWPQEKVIRLRAEQAALTERPDPTTMRQFCANMPPISGRGMFACVQANAGDAEQRKKWVKQAYLQGDFSGIEEDAILAEYRGQFTAADHQARMDRLLFEGKVQQAKRMMPLLAPNYRLLSEARIALIANARNANAKLHGVPSSLKNHSGLTFNRIQWRARNGQDEGVLELLLNGPNNPPYADFWWPYRARAVREAVEDKRYKQAMAILAKHGELNPENNADALFLKGWISLEFTGDPRNAYKDFYKLYGDVATPVSKARAAYWAARAATKNGNADIAKEWYAKAANYSTVFYGQLAAAEMNPGASLKLPAKPSGGVNFSGEALPGTALWLAGKGELDMANAFLAHIVDRSDDPSRAQSLADMCMKQGYRHGSVKVAKQALRQNIVLAEAGWPKLDVPAQSPIEPALALAITRQESEFNAKARSSADARGLMQVLPGTANHTAKRNGLRYDARHLYEPQPNMVIGTTYLGGLINGWDGSYVMAIASYNAGPANVRKWVARFGAPPRDVHGMVNWIEKIPFAETRNYVQRVLENVQVYRARIKADTPLGIEKDLKR